MDNMSKFVRFYKECIHYGIGEGLDIPGCIIIWKDNKITIPCFEECGLRCKEYKIKKVIIKNE